MIAKSVYLLCAFTALACTIMLYKGYRRNQVPFLFWSTLCFLGLSLNNVLLTFDLLVYPESDFSILRTLPALAGLAALTYGLIWRMR